jgi:hypothetical protein
MEDIVEFNQLLFQQISQKKDVELDPLRGAQKNYLLVPLSLQPGQDRKFSYKVDFRIVEATVNE